MSNIKSAIILLILGVMLVLPPLEVQAQEQGGGLDPRMKALGMMAVYGTAGGFLLGTAALAFDAPGRSPFIGASLGLYAGILFGTYVVVTYAVKKHKLENPGDPEDENYYPETPESPYEGPFQSQSLKMPPVRSLQFPSTFVEEGRIQSWNERTALKSDVAAPSFFINVLNITF
ncbi:MAG: hypothetical protein HYV97_01855 [Bdellovibrio sp.]|nr:hypothetical protein [Bdellovibrio sp.]